MADKSLVKKSSKGNGLRLVHTPSGESNVADIVKFSGGRVYDCGFGAVCVDYYQTVIRASPGDWVICDDDGCQILSDEDVQRTYVFDDGEPVDEGEAAARKADKKTLRADDAKADENTVSGGEAKRESFRPGGAANVQDVRGSTTAKQPESTPANRDAEKRKS